MEREIVMFVINGSMKLAVPPDRPKKIQVRSRSVVISRIFDLKFNGIHLAQVILNLWGCLWKNIIDVPICEIEPRCQLFTPGLEQILYKICFIWEE